jgi:dCMP deaminase
MTTSTPPPPIHTFERPDKDTYFLLIALAARTRADCIGRHHGAVVSREGRVVSTGYNGTPFGVPNCSEGGCLRCSQRLTNDAPRSGAYDVCICVHAEQNAILTAARFGQQTLGGAMTCTTQPCFGCLKEMLQVGITKVHYLHKWDPVEAYGDSALAAQYDALSSRFDDFRQISDPALDTPDLFGGFLRELETATPDQFSD